MHRLHRPQIQRLSLRCRSVGSNSLPNMASFDCLTHLDLSCIDVRVGSEELLTNFADFFIIPSRSRMGFSSCCPNRSFRSNSDLASPNFQKMWSGLPLEYLVTNISNAHFYLTLQVSRLSELQLHTLCLDRSSVTLALLHRLLSRQSSLSTLDLCGAQNLRSLSQVLKQELLHYKTS